LRYFRQRLARILEPSAAIEKSCLPTEDQKTGKEDNAITVPNGSPIRGQYPLADCQEDAHANKRYNSGD